MKGYLTLLLLFGGTLLVAQNRGELISYQENFDLRPTEAREVINDLVPLDLPDFLVNILVYVKYPMKGYKVVYQTVDFDGNPTQASGLVVIPDLYGCSGGLAAYCHGTIFDRQAVPSNYTTENGGPEDLIGLAFGGAGYITAIPDYLGMGEGPGFHPFVDSRTEATATVDMLRAARKLCSILAVRLSGQVFLSGYSQGGHAAMATLKEITEKHAREFDVAFAGLGSGPYDLSRTQYDFIFDNPQFPSPQFVPYVVGSCQATRGNLYTHPSDIFVSPYDSLYEVEILGQTGNTTWVPTPWTEMFVPGYLDEVARDATHPLRSCLQESDVYNWKNTTATTMYFCPPDEQIDPENAKLTKNKQRGFFPWYKVWQRSLIKAVNSGGFDHPNCAIPSILLSRAGFNIRRKLCIPRFRRQGGELPDQAPIPMLSHMGVDLAEQQYFHIQVDASKAIEKIQRIEVLDVSGKLTTQIDNPMSSVIEIDTQGLTEGFYFVKIQTTQKKEYWGSTLLNRPELLSTEAYDPISPNPLAIRADLDLSHLEEPVQEIRIRDQRGKIVQTYPVSDQEHISLTRGQLGLHNHTVEVLAGSERYFLPLHTTNELLPEDLRISPHPVRDRSTLDLSLFEEPVKAIRLYDLQGKLIHTQLPESFDQQAIIQRNDVIGGVYVLQLETAHQVYHSKIMIE